MKQELSDEELKSISAGDEKGPWECVYIRSGDECIENPYCNWEPMDFGFGFCVPKE